MNIPLLLLAVLCGTSLLVEAALILKNPAGRLPIPAQLLRWVLLGMLGPEKTMRRFAGQNTPQQLRTYAIFAAIFGSGLLLASFIHLNWLLSL